MFLLLLFVYKDDDFQDMKGKIGSVQVPEIKDAMRKFDLFWPQSPRGSHFLDTFVRLAKEMPWAAIMTAQLNARLRIVTFEPSFNYLVFLDMRRNIINENQYEKYFDILRSSFLEEEQSAITFVDHLSLENVILGYFGDSMIRGTEVYTNLTDLWELESHEDFIEDWERVMNKYFSIGPNEMVLARIRKSEFFHKLLTLPEISGTEEAMQYMSWIVVQVLFLYSNLEIMTYRYGSLEEAVVQHKQFCFYHTERMFGFAFNANHINSLINTTIRWDVVEMFRLVRSSFDVLLHKNPWYPDPLPGPSYVNNSANVLDYFDRSNATMLQSTFGHYEGITDKLTLNWATATKGLGQSEGKLISPQPFTAIEATGLESSVLLSRMVNNNSVILMPYALSYPVYNHLAPRSIKYATLGSEIASVFSKMLMDHQTTASVRTKIKDEEGCLMGETDGVGKKPIVHRTIGVNALWLAFQEAKKESSEKTPLRDLPGYSSDQLFFLFWCYLQCGHQLGKDICNRPLRHSPHFAKTFNCSSNSPMSSPWRCSIFRA